MIFVKVTEELESLPFYRVSECFKDLMYPVLLFCDQRSGRDSQRICPALSLSLSGAGGKEETGGLVCLLAIN